MPAGRSRYLSYANVMATVAVFLALGGSAYAVATGSIGTRELKDNDVRTVDLRNDDVRARDIRNGTLGGADVRDDALTGADIREATLDTVPAATTASRAAVSERATRAGAADRAANAEHAELADRIAAPENFHAVGAPGEPPFGSGCVNLDDNSALPPVGFYKDREGVVHLQGVYACTGPGAFVFNLPAGYRPAAGKAHTEIVACFGAGACAESHNATLVQVLGSGFSPTSDGAMFAQTKVAVLDGIAFRAAS
jgi:hypothetical protein